MLSFSFFVKLHVEIKIPPKVMMFKPLGMLMALFGEEPPKESMHEPPPTLRDVDDNSGVEVRLSFTFTSFTGPIRGSTPALLTVAVSILSLLFTFPMLLEGNWVDTDDGDAEVDEVDAEVVELKT